MFGEYAEMSIDRDFWTQEQYYSDVSNGIVAEDVEYTIAKKQRTLKFTKEIQVTEKSIKLITELGEKWFSKKHCTFTEDEVVIPTWLFHKLFGDK